MKIEHKKIFRDPSKVLKNISWPINICQKYFMTFTKTLRPTSYILNVRSLTWALLEKGSYGKFSDIEGESSRNGV